MSKTPTYAEDAHLARGWITARSWMASILSLMALTFGATVPRHMALDTPVRLAMLRRVRRVESLVRRLVLAMAVETPLPAPPPPAPGPDPKAPQVTIIPFETLGLARHWSPPEPTRSTKAAARQPVSERPLTLKMVEPMPALAGQTWREHGRRYRAPGLAGQDNPALLRRVRALADVLAAPRPMALRMRRWLARRPGMPDKQRRPSPITIGYHNAPVRSDAWRTIAEAGALARERLWRRDREDGL